MRYLVILAALLFAAPVFADSCDCDQTGKCTCDRSKCSCPTCAAAKNCGCPQAKCICPPELCECPACNQQRKEGAKLKATDGKGDWTWTKAEGGYWWRYKVVPTTLPKYNPAPLYYSYPAFGITGGCRS